MIEHVDSVIRYGGNHLRLHSQNLLKAEKDWFQILESLRAFTAGEKISPPAGGTFCKAKNGTTIPAVFRGISS